MPPSKKKSDDTSDESRKTSKTKKTLINKMKTFFDIFKIANITFR